MLSPLRNRFGIPGVISVVALVFAMLGGAYAASNEGGKATSSAKAKKGPRGPKGATGPAGPAGPAGPQGPKGDTGAPGGGGAPGKDGESVKLASASGADCPEGGANLTVGAASSNVCNGAEGEQGIPGSPWTVDSTLPVGATETGAWAFGETGPSGALSLPISFPVKLPAALDQAHVHFINANGLENVLNTETFLTEQVTPANCHGEVSAPTADTGHLCVYTGVLNGASPGYAVFHVNAIRLLNGTTEPGGASTAGARLFFSDLVAGANGVGSWAVSR